MEMKYEMAVKGFLNQMNENILGKSLKIET